MIIHALTFNLPETVSEGQYSALRALPLFLREHLSCSLCRSHVKEHLIELGVPTSRKARRSAMGRWIIYDTDVIDVTEMMVVSRRDGIGSAATHHSRHDGIGGDASFATTMGRWQYTVRGDGSSAHRHPVAVSSGSPRRRRRRRRRHRRREGFDWAFFFWRAHNYVNEQSEVTRCGDMDCQWGAWNSPSPKFLCAGVYRYPWFLEWEKAATQWRIPRVNPHSSDDATADGAAEGAGARRSGRPLALGFREM